MDTDPAVAPPFPNMTNEHFTSTPKQATRAVVTFSTPSRPRKSSLIPSVGPTSPSVSRLSTSVQTQASSVSVQGMTKQGEVEALGRPHPPSTATLKVSAEAGGSKSPLSSMKGQVTKSPGGSPSRHPGANQDQYPRPQFYHPSQHTTHPPSKPQGQGMTLAARRRQSRYDPMAADEEMDEEGYGELGHRHPLRRVAEEEGKEVESVSLPGIKALFGVAGGECPAQHVLSIQSHALTRSEHPPTPSTTSGSLYNSPSLPSLVPNSPSSPSTTRTSRYSSLTSQLSSASEPFQPGSGGWWAPEFDRGPLSSSGSPRYPGPHRANSYPTVQPYIDEHADKRRRSDGPPPLRDSEESARLRWQAQSRNASYPTSGPALTPTGSASGGLRSLLHPPPSSSAMSRASVSGSSGFNSPLTPFHEHPGTLDEYPFDRRIAPVPSRSSSIVGGQLAQSFADLSASERADRRSPSTHTDMAPPSVPDRRQSSFHLSQTPDSAFPRPNLPPMNLSRPPSTGPPISRPPSTGPGSQASRRQSLSRPASPDDALRPALRRSSLTEAIMANSGDRIPATSGFHSGPPTAHSTPLEKPFPQDCRLHPPAPLITGWPVRRVSTGSAASTPGISLNSDNEGPASAPVSVRGKKRAAETKEEADEDMAGDPGMRGMEVLAESASRIQEAEKDHEDSDHSPTKNGSVSSASGLLQGTIVPGQGGAGPKYACAFCAKTFSRPSSLRIHTYSREFYCPVWACH